MGMLSQSSVMDSVASIFNGPSVKCIAHQSIVRSQQLAVLSVSLLFLQQ